MAKMLLLATDRGLWRASWSAESPPGLHDFSVDAPDEAIVALVGRGAVVRALTETGRCLDFEASAGAFRELEAWPEDEAEISCAALLEDGRLLVGTVPPQIWTRESDGSWSRLPDLSTLAGASDWKGLEAPYEARISAVAEAPWGELIASVSVGGLLRLRGDCIEAMTVDAELPLPRDIRDLAVHGNALWLATGQGLFRLEGRDGPLRRLSLPPSAAFAARLHPQGDAMAVVAATGPPATWRGPDGARMSVWSFADEPAGHPRMGPFHGVVTDLCADEADLLAVTDDGELWRWSPADPRPPEEPLLADLPAIRGIFLIDPVATAD